MLSEEDGGRAGALEYNPDLFDQGTMLRVQEHFRHLLTSIVANAGKCSLRVAVVAAGGTATSVDGVQGQTVRLYEGVAIHHLFEEQAARTPDAVAGALVMEIRSCCIAN